MFNSGLEIFLTEEEQAVFVQIEFDVLPIHVDRSAAIHNGALACELTKLLQDRDAIPQHRWEYFINPDYNIGGRGKSRYDVFRENLRSGQDICEHPHFLPYLRYFVLGPDLPKSVLHAFTWAVKECGTVTSGDLLPLGNLANKLTKKLGVARDTAREEFFKLVLEFGVQPNSARTIRDQIR